MVKTDKSWLRTNNDSGIKVLDEKNEPVLFSINIITTEAIRRNPPISFTIPKKVRKWKTAGNWSGPKNAKDKAATKPIDNRYFRWDDFLKTKYIMIPITKMKTGIM
jgi:hypothetical protein